MPLRRLLLLAPLPFLAAVPASAQIGAGSSHLHPRLVAESKAPAPGSDVALAIAFAPDPGWHGYWANPGDAGTPTDITWTLPAGVVADVMAGGRDYPVPTMLLVSGLMNYVYEAPYALMGALRLPAGLAPGTALPIRAALDYLACTRELCVPQHAELATTLTVGDGRADPAVAASFATWRAALPKPLGGEATIARAGGMVRLAIPLPAAVAVTQPWLFPLGDGAIDYAAPQSITRTGDRLIVEVKAARGGGRPAGFEGVLRIAPGSGLSFSAVPGAVPAAGTAIEGRGAAAGHRWLVATLVALAGAVAVGLILAVMPRVRSSAARR